jgi:hypothetical protein
VLMLALRAACVRGRGAYAVIGVSPQLGTLLAGRIESGKPNQNAYVASFTGSLPTHCTD